MDATLEPPVTTRSNDTPEQAGTVTGTVPKRVRIQQRDQAVRLQAFAYHAAMALQESVTDRESGKLVMTPATALCVHKLIGAWDTARDAVRVLRGKGLPASVKSKPGQTGQGQVQPL